ncbi:conserved oligomeric Golgi complex subunit 1-like isoform X2 [Haliotis cracherodii]|uniref:conserved oligomeric Golgi complex subunit 1-like isoform X1 n=1 Tax=Haliotis cracherodii TaxID=6455 RepID=UPI0039EB7DA8
MATDTHRIKPPNEMDTNSLFDKMTIEEIRDTEKKIRLDIEKKKEDLRVMVGERYRDLIEAADTIKDMKTSSENVTQSIGHMEDMCKQLKQNYMVRGVSYHQKVKADNTTGKKKQEAEFYGVAAQIKLLLDMPEKIWSSNDSRDYLTATQLYLLARHVNTSLQLNSQRSANILSWFPVLTRQWAAISHFKNTILQGCRNSLKDLEGTYTDKQIAEFLCSILLLEDSTPRQVFNEFLLARTKALQQALHTSLHGNIKDQVSSVVRLLINTVHQIHAVFYNTAIAGEKEKGGQCNLLSEILEQVLNKSQEAGGLLSLQGSISAKCLPKSVKDFRPVLRSAGSTISSQHIQDNCQQWINTCINDIKSGVGKLLGFVNTVKRLADIRDSLWELLTQDGDESQWDLICRRVVNKTLRVWGDFLQPLFVDRVKQLIQYQLETAAELTKRNVSKVMIELTPDTNDSSLQHETNLASYLWTESSGDIAASSVWTPSNKSLADGGGLILKARAFTPAVQSLCRHIDDKLKNLLEDNKPYLQVEEEEEGAGSGVKKTLDTPGPFDKYGDSMLILTYVQSASTTAVQDVLNYLTEQLKLWQKSFEIPDPTTNFSTENKILLVGRLCSALAELAPHLQQCILGPVVWQKSDTVRSVKKVSKSSKQTEHPEWASVRTKLDECKLQAYKFWVDQITKVSVSEFSKALHAENLSSVVEHATRWDEVDIQEETEEGKKHSSKIMVPMQPSWYLHSLLFKLCQDLNKVGGQALPRSVVQDLLHKMTDGIVNVYQDFVKGGKRRVRKSGLPLTQQQALQSLFDIRYLLQIIPRKDDTKTSKTYQKKAHSICESLEEVVDPFDLDVFSPYMQVNLHRQSQRTAVIFGSLAALDKQSVVSTGRAPAAGQHEQHNVLPLSSCNSRFPLLPLSTQQSRSSMQSYVPSQTITRGLDSGNQSLTLAVEAVLPKSASQTDLSSSLYDKLGSMGSRFFSKLQDK